MRSPGLVSSLGAFFASAGCGAAAVLGLGAAMPAEALDEGTALGLGPSPVLARLMPSAPFRAPLLTGAREGARATVPRKVGPPRAGERDGVRGAVGLEPKRSGSLGRGRETERRVEPRTGLLTPRGGEAGARWPGALPEPPAEVGRALTVLSMSLMSSSSCAVGDMLCEVCR
mmetsp:Transcript_105649/g.340729  ORF Transcript_105649/g.340729 Transcript_105649/m.340729 type:complete len:172 (+) Transcript_105649:150-665(+)